MFEKFLSTNSRDFRQRYEGTWGFYRDEKKKRMLAQLVSITENVCNFVDSRGVQYRLNIDAEKDIGFEFLPPRSGYFNTDKGAFLVQRVAARQFQRGISERNVTVAVLISGGHLNQRVDFTTLGKVYENTVPYKDAREAFEKKATPSWALSPQFALDGGGLVWVLAERIGKYTQKDSNYIFTLDDPSLWRTEIADAGKAVGCAIEIN
jgi:hypothetical protein